MTGHHSIFYHKRETDCHPPEFLKKSRGTGNSRLAAKNSGQEIQNAANIFETDTPMAAKVKLRAAVNREGQRTQRLLSSARIR
jgi:hypothetical protein